MELSDLKYYHGHLIAPDDKTGILFKCVNLRLCSYILLKAYKGLTFVSSIIINKCF